MKFEHYQELRNGLVEESEQLINEGKLEEAKAKMKEIEELDNKFEQVKLEMANLNALKEQSVQAIELENLSVNYKGDMVSMEKFEQTQISNEKIYETAFAKAVMGLELTQQENAVFEQYNYTHTTDNTGAVIPDNTLNEIISEISAQNPFFGDARHLCIKGIVKLPKHQSITSGDAKGYKEDEALEAEENVFVDIQLGAKEVAKYIEVSFKLEAMSIPAFMSYLKQEIVERLGAELGRQAINGDGGVKEMTGVLTALADVTEQQATYDETKGLTYKEVTATVAKLGSQHVNNAVFYANNSTVWNVLANVVDGNGRPIFINDATSGGVGRVLGFPVKVDSAIPDGVILLANAKGYTINTNQAVTVESSRDIKTRKTGFSAYTIIDGNVTHEKAFVVLQPQA